LNPACGWIDGFLQTILIVKLTHFQKTGQFCSLCIISSEAFYLCKNFKQMKKQYDPQSHRSKMLSPFLVFRFLMLVGMLHFLVPEGHAQSYGCTDPKANNFDPDATLNDGSCLYNLTVYKPEQFMLLPEILEETSGLIFWDGGLWSHNDSGGEPEIYKVDTITGQVVQTIRLSNGNNVDWEELTQDEDNIYIGDFGNNAGNRDDLKIYILPKSSIPASGNAELPAEILNFTYDDQKKLGDKKWRENNFDCEAMIFANDSIFLFSKNWLDLQTKLYVLPAQPGTFVAEKIAAFDIKGLVTGADYNETENEISLCGYNNYVPFMEILWDFEGTQFFSGNKRRIDFPEIIASQTEGIAYYHGKRLFISAERTAAADEKVYRLGTSEWTNASATEIAQVSDQKIGFSINPNPIKAASFKVKINKVLANGFVIEIFDTLGKIKYFGDFELGLSNQNIVIKFKSKQFAPGLYIVKIISGGYYATRKVIIE
jgi:type IX secretion system substrate protein